MKAVVDRIVQYANRYQLTNVETGEVLGTFDFEEVTGTVQQVGTEIDKELFDSIANDLAARVKLSGGELAGTIVTFSDISGTAANVASGDSSATLWGKVKNWFSRLKALAFKNKVASGDFEAGAIKNADVAADADIAQSKVKGLMTDYVASISVSGRTVTYKNKNGVDMGSITTQDTTYGLASQSSNGLMSATDKTKLDGIQSGAQKNTVVGVKGSSESAYRTGNVNITKANIGLGNVDNTSDEDKPVSTATQTALNGKANTSGTYPNLTVGKATNADNATNATNATNAKNATNAINAANATKATQDANGNVIDTTYATKTELTEKTGTKVNVNGATQTEVNFTSDPQTQITEAQSDISDIIDGSQTVGKATTADSATNASQLGGVDASSYAKLSQVVRVDVQQSMTDDKKAVFYKNSKYRVQTTVQLSEDTWKTVGVLDNYGQINMTIATSIAGTMYNCVQFFLSISYLERASITSIGNSEASFVKAIRLRSKSNAQTFIDVLIGATASEGTIGIEFDVTMHNKYTIYDFKTLNFVDVTDDESDFKTTITIQNKGIDTTGTICQQGAPVLVGSAPTWVTGISGSLTLPSGGWYIFEAGSGTTGIVYWDETMTPFRYVITNEFGNTYILVTRSGNISASGGDTSPTVSYYKLA